MNEDTIRKIASEEIKKDKQKSQYGVTRVPAHTHNNIDSLPVPFTNIGGVTSYLNLSRVTLTSAQVKLLHTTPITLVPAPVPANSSARIVTIVLGVAAYLAYNGTAYTGANNLEFRYTNAAGTKVTTDMVNTFINSAANAYDYAPAITTEFTPIANTPIIVSVPTANPATGNSPITFVVHYRLITF